MRQPLFCDNEIVRVIGGTPESRAVVGERGIVRVVWKDEGTDEFLGGYFIWVYSLEEMWSFYEEELETTKEFDHDHEAKTYDGTSIKVGVDEDGHGYLIEDEDNERDSVVDDRDE